MFIRPPVLYAVPLSDTPRQLEQFLQCRRLVSQPQQHLFEFQYECVRAVVTLVTLLQIFSPKGLSAHTTTGNIVLVGSTTKLIRSARLLKYLLEILTALYFYYEKIR
jgi:hypothetical protein